MRLRDRSGEQVGPLHVVMRGEDQGGKVTWIAICVCGRELQVSKHTLARIENNDPMECACRGLRGPDHCESRRIDKNLRSKDSKSLIENLYSENGKDEWQIGVLRDKKRKEIARGRC